MGIDHFHRVRVENDITEEKGDAFCYFAVFVVVAVY